MDTFRKAIFGKSKNTQEPDPEPVPVAQPLVHSQPAYGGQPYQPYSGHQPQHFPATAAPPYPTANQPPSYNSVSAGTHHPVPAPRQAPSRPQPPYGGGHQPYPAQQQHQQHQQHQHQHQQHQHQHQHAPYPSHSQPPHQPQHQQHQQPVAAPRSSLPPELPSALRAMRINKPGRGPGLERTMSYTGSTLDKIPMEVSKKYASTSSAVSLPIGFRIMQAPDLDQLTYDFETERKILRM